MSRILVAYGSKHGATQEISEAIAAVIGSAVYIKRWRPEARHFSSACSAGPA